MRPVDQFLQSVREGFKENQAGDWTQLGLLLLSAVALSIALSVWLGRWRKRRAVLTRIDALAASTGLKHADVEYLGRIAAGSGSALVDVMTALAPFERATAAALASETAVPHPAEHSVFERVRHLRKALGFSPLPAHHWLLSTRELVVGDRVTLASVGGVGRAATTVTEVNEASFAVDLPLTMGAGSTAVVGAVANLAIVRADDSRYLSRVHILAIETDRGTASGSGAAVPVRRMFFAHNEQPERQQNREHVRVRVNGKVTVRIVGAAETATEAPATATAPTLDGTLADVSAGGLSMNLPLAGHGSIPRGARLRCSFTLNENADFDMLAAVVSDAGAGPGTGVQHIRVSFSSLADAERDRLASAVTRLQARPSGDGI